MTCGILEGVFRHGVVVRDDLFAFLHEGERVRGFARSNAARFSSSLLK
jgi:hypothetical protein